VRAVQPGGGDYPGSSTCLFRLQMDGSRWVVAQNR
jgi:hypothetical protein